MTLRQWDFWCGLSSASQRRTSLLTSTYGGMEESTSRNSFTAGRMKKFNGHWSLKKWCYSSKQVRFSSPIKLPSLTVKKSHVLGILAIKLGSFSCPLQDHRPASKAQTLSSISVIPSSRVFGNLRHHSNFNFNTQNPTIKCSSSLHRPKRESVTPPFQLPRTPRPSTQKRGDNLPLSMNLRERSSTAETRICYSRVSGKD
jgi:hypothetical protein